MVGFGGYVLGPGVPGRPSRGVPIVVHEANPRPGLANRLGARLTTHVATATAGRWLADARYVGMPMRRRSPTLDRAARRADKAGPRFGLEPDRPPCW